MAETVKKIPRAGCPEEVGVSSKVVLDFINEMEDAGIELHSFIVMRHGKVAAECYRKPFDRDIPHQMYSVSKSFTSTAVGFAIEEGLISLDTSVVEIFPDYLEGEYDERLDRITVRTLLNMTAGKSPKLLSDKGKIDWIEDFLAAPYYAEPGEKFRYTNENIYMLCAILFRVTGMCVRDYLEPRLFGPLGIAYPFWETDQKGIEAGGWGIYVKTEDFAKLMLCYAQDGVFEGKQVIPAQWTRAATAPQANSDVCTCLDSSNGYGYCFWMNGGCPDSYRADGMFSQFGLVFKEYDAVFICTGGNACEQDARDYIWQYFPKAFDDSLTEQDTLKDFAERMHDYPIDRPALSPRSTREIMIDGRTIKVRKKILLNLIGFPMSVIPLAVTYMMTEKSGNIDNICLNFDDEACQMFWTEGKYSNSVSCGMDGHFRYGNIKLCGIDFRVCCNAEWLDNDNLQVTIRPVETVAKRMLKFRFKNSDRVNIYPSSTPDVKSIALALSGSILELLGDNMVGRVAQFAMLKVVPSIVEPVHRGRILK